MGIIEADKRTRNNDEIHSNRESVEENREQEPISTEPVTYADVARGKCLTNNDSLKHADEQ